MTRLRRFLLTNSNEFQICVNEIKITLFKFDENVKNNIANDFFEKNEKNNFTNNFFNVFDEKFNVIIDK